jgi:transcription elongation factor Elf1
MEKQTNNLITVKTTTQQAMIELLPCPFCGSTNLRFEFSGSQGYIECNECGTEGPCDEKAADPICDMDAAYLAWNRRA